MDTQIQQTGVSSKWNKIPVFIRAIVTGLLVNTLAVGLWPALALQLSIPIAFALMVIFLWAYCKYFSGSWWPESTITIRKENFRDTQLKAQIWVWGSFGALLFFFNKVALGELFFRLWPYPADAYADTIAYFQGMTPAMAMLAIVMTSVVAGIAEETGFRGYMQKPLEKKYGPVAAITIVGLIFTLVHVPHVTDLPYLLLLFALSSFFGVLAYATNSLLIVIILHAMMDIHAFSHLTGFLGDGSAPHPTIFESGVDGHFVLTLGIVILSTSLFVLVVKRLLQFKMNQ